MDSKPLRPLKTLRGGGDENVLQPELHQKYKSTGALSAKMMAAGGGLRAAAKRTAFGDLSNTNNNLGGAVQDDCAINVKGNEAKKVLAAPSTTIFRPPMRSTAPIANSQNHPLPVAKQVQYNKAQAVPSKRTNAVFKDSEHEPSMLNAPTELQHRFHTKEQVLDERRSEPVLDYVMPAIDGRPVSVAEFLEFTRARDEAAKKAEEARKRAELVQEVEQKDEESTQMYKKYMKLLTDDGDRDEVWDLEDEDDDDQDQDYMTAHSFRSKGDNTTGGVTTVLFPQFTSKARNEIKNAAELVESTRSKQDIEEEAWDTSMVAEYADDIFHYMKELEIEFLPPPNYMDFQGEIQWSMRAVLMDWMIQVHQRCGLTPETLFLCVNCIDRFLALKIVSLGKLQLVGATALFIAAKYEEINCPSLSEIVFMVDGGYTADEILKAERFMLMMLSFKLGAPGPLSFLRRVSKADDYDLLTRTLAKYFMEITIMDERFISCPASFIAAGAHCASRLVLKKEEWTQHHVHYSGYTFEQLKPIVCLMLQCCEHAQQHHAAVFEKFSEKRYQRASLIVQTEMTTGVGIIVPGQKNTYHAYGSINLLPATTTAAAPFPQTAAQTATPAYLYR